MSGDVVAPLVTERMPIARLVPAAYNPRTISKRALAGLGESLKRFGLLQPVVWNRRTERVVGGHQRLKALAAQGVTATDVVVVDLPEAEEKALNLTLNNPAIQGEFSDDAADLLDEVTLALPLETEALLFRDLRTDLVGVPDAPAEPVDEDDVPDAPAEPVTRPGDLYVMGEHRLLCGDSRKPEDVARLCAGVPADVLWTDPPYGVSYVGKTEDALTIRNDDREGLAGLLTLVFARAFEALAPSARFYVAAPAGPQGSVFRALLDGAGLRLHQVLVWVKDSFVLGHSDYHYRHEDILYGHKPGEGRAGRGRHAGTRWYGGNAQDTVLEVPRPKRSADHPTTKPVELVRRCLRNSAEPGDVVLDLFCGSGTTLVACEHMGLRGRGLELDPRYVDVVVARWERLTGQKATRERA